MNVSPLRDRAGIKQMPVEIEGVPAQADFDPGNGLWLAPRQEPAPGEGTTAD